MSCLHWQGYFQKKKTCQRVEVEVCHWIALKNEGCRSPGSLQLRSSAAFFLATFFGLECLLSVLLCFLRLILQQFTLPVNLSLMLNYIPVLSALFSLSRLELVQLRDPEWATYWDSYSYTFWIWYRCMNSCWITCLRCFCGGCWSGSSSRWGARTPGTHLGCALSVDGTETLGCLTLHCPWSYVAHNNHNTQSCGSVKFILLVMLYDVWRSGLQFQLHQ